jgi:predicted PurR-regulated permease PerM
LTSGSKGGPQHRTAKICLVAGLILLALWIDRHLLPALLWAVILAIATGPLHEHVARKYPGLHRGALLPAIFATVAALAVSVPLIFGLAEAARERAEVVNSIASARANGVPVPQWVRQLPLGANELSRWWQDNLGTPAAASQELSELHAAAAQRSREIGSDIVHRAVVLGMTLVAYFFLLRDGEAIVAQLRVAGDRMLGSTGERVGRQVVLSVRGTINGRVFVGIGEGALMAVVYWIAGAPHPVLLGAVTAIAAMIPFGAIVVFALAALLLLGQGSVAWAVAVVVIGLLVVGIADHVVRPALIGGATRLPFLLVLFGILGGVETLGLLGLFVGPSVMAALVLLWRDYVHARLLPDHSL